jgi:hypothetical protein
MPAAKKPAVRRTVKKATTAKRPTVRKAATAVRRAPVRRKSTAAKKKTASSAGDSPHKIFMTKELARLKKQHGFVTGSSTNKVEWSTIFSQACANWSAKK